MIIEKTECDPPHLVAEAVVVGTMAAVAGTMAAVDTIADTDEGILFVPEAVVTGGSVAAAASIAMAIRLYVIGSNCLTSCRENVLSLVTSEAAKPYMIQTSVSL